MTGIVLVSHSGLIVQGLAELLKEIAKDVPLTTAGGLETGDIGTTFDRIEAAVNANPADTLYVFYDLGSAKMNCEMVQETADKTIYLSGAAMIEGAFVAATLISAGAEQSVIDGQLKPLQVK